MVEIKFVGKGGQGVVVASEILAKACFSQDLYSQCYSLFGGERRGAPVAAFIRVSKDKIHLKCDIETPDHLVIFNAEPSVPPELLNQLRPGGVILLNRRQDEGLPALSNYQVGVIDALEISKRHGLRSIVNTSVLGAYARLTGLVELDKLLQAIEETVPAAKGPNLAAARDAFEELQIL